MTRGKFSTKSLTWIRNIALAAEMLTVLLLWTFVPAVIENNTLVHAGNGKYGPGAAFLLLALLPLLGLFTREGHKWGDGEIHTEDVVERARLEDAQKAETLKCQILLSAFLFLGACFGMIAAVCLG